MAALPVVPLASSDLVQNGGNFIVEGGPAEGVYALASTDDYPSEGGAAQPVYVVSAAEITAGRGLVRGTGPRYMKQVASGSRPLIGGAAKPVYVLGGAFDAALLGGGAVAYSQKLLNLFGSSIVGYWPMWEPSGSVSTDIGGRGHNGAYTAVTLAQTGIGDGRTSAQFDGATSLNNIYSSGLNTDFNNQELSLMIWLKPFDSTAWSDATVRHIVKLANSAGTSVVQIRKVSANTLQLNYQAGGTAKAISAAYSALTWTHLAISASKAGDAAKYYINGVQTGATQTALGVWVGALDSTFTLIGVTSTGGTLGWKGYLAHALLLNRSATPEEILGAATVP